MQIENPYALGLLLSGHLPARDQAPDADPRDLTAAELEDATDDVMDAWLADPSTYPDLSERLLLDCAVAAILGRCGQAQADAIAGVRQEVRAAARWRVEQMMRDTSWIAEWRARHG